MLLILTLYLLQGPIHAAPLYSFQRDTTLASASFSPVQCVCPNQRSIWDILWSCLTVIFACSWVSVHPNMPGPGEPWWKVTLRRLGLMLWAVLAPEMILMWAMRQWLGARSLERLYWEKNWTKTHGYFIQMGGFMLYEDDRARGILSPEKLKKLYEDGKIDFPTITEEEIHDRSKADNLAKIVVIGQTTWFITQCIARGIQGLALTQLELVTLAFAFLNGLMYLFWWNKPMDVQSSIPVYMLAEPKKRPGITHAAPSGDPSENIFRFSQLKKYLLNTVHFIVSPCGHAISAFSKLVEDKGVLWIVYAIFILIPGHGIVLIIECFLDIFDSDSTNTIKQGQLRVATFYALKTVDSESAPCEVAISGIAVAFGSIHCAGWFLVFPSHSEGLIWQISSVITTGVPFPSLIITLFEFWLLAFPNTTYQKILDVMELTFGIPLIFLGIPAYILSRIFLLVEAFTGLRALPAGARAVVEWTSFIPHKV